MTELERAREESVRIGRELADAGAALEAARGRAADIREKLGDVESARRSSAGRDVLHGAGISAETLAYEEAALRYRGELDAAETVTVPRLEERVMLLRQAETSATEHEDEVCHGSVASACCRLLEGLEETCRQREIYRAGLRSVVAEQRRRAYQPNVNGRPPEATAAYRQSHRLEAMMEKASAVPSDVPRDVRTGPELFAAMTNGTATFGDVSRFEPAFQGVVDGTGYINRERPAENPLPSPPDGVNGAEASNPVEMSFEPLAGSGEAAGDRIVAMLVEGRR